MPNIGWSSRTDIFLLRFCECWNGIGYLTRGGCATALDQLWRDFDDHFNGRVWDNHGYAQTSPLDDLNLSCEQKILPTVAAVDAGVQFYRWCVCSL